MARSKTEIGDINPNGQRLVAKTGEPGTDHFQHIWIVQCTRPDVDNFLCGHHYGSNGSDFFQRKCPQCQKGQTGPAISHLPVVKKRVDNLRLAVLRAALTEGEESGEATDFDFDAFINERTT